MLSRVTVIRSAAAGACLVMALVHLFIWSQDRLFRANLCFAVMVIGPFGLAACDLLTMHGPRLILSIVASALVPTSPLLLLKYPIAKLTQKLFTGLVGL